MQINLVIITIVHCVETQKFQISSVTLYKVKSCLNERLKLD